MTDYDPPHVTAIYWPLILNFITIKNYNTCHIVTLSHMLDLFHILIYIVPGMHNVFYLNISESSK